LQISAVLCIVFLLNQSRQEGVKREKKKRKNKTKQIGPGCLTLLPAVPSQQRARQASNNCLTLPRAVIHCKKLV
jgi:hypothetical protein